MEHKINSYLDQAADHLHKAHEELCKPEEDVVPYSICKNAHGAITNLLSAFLMSNGRDLPEAKTVESMLPLCSTLHSRFEELHLEPFFNPTETEDIWMNLDAANDYLKIAEKTQSLVLSSPQNPAV